MAVRVLPKHVAGVRFSLPAHEYGECARENRSLIEIVWERSEPKYPIRVLNL